MSTELLSTLPRELDKWANQLILGDCLEVMKKLPAGSIDAVVTDPPFAFTGGISNGRTACTSDQFFSFWWKAVCTELTRILKPEAEGFIWCDWRTAKTLAEGFEPDTQTYDYFRISQMLYHYREMPGQGQPFRNSVDLIAYLRGPKSKGYRIQNTTHNWISKYWYYGKHEFHPSEKDVSIAEQLISWCSDVGAIVVDPFCGSGTTLIAARNSKRHYIGIEKDPVHHSTAKKRLGQGVLPL